LRGARRPLAVRFAQTQCRAPVEWGRVAVVAAFRAFNDAIAALRIGADTRLALTPFPKLNLAALRAPVAGFGVAVVALFGSSHQAVPTASDLPARLAGSGAAKPGFDLQTLSVAAVPGNLVAVVARFV